MALDPIELPVRRQAHHQDNPCDRAATDGDRPPRTSPAMVAGLLQGDLHDLSSGTAVCESSSAIPVAPPTSGRTSVASTLLRSTTKMARSTSISCAPRPLSTTSAPSFALTYRSGRRQTASPPSSLSKAMRRSSAACAAARRGGCPIRRRAWPALVVAQEPKGDMHDRFVYAASEPLSGWVAIALAFSLGVPVVIAAAMRPGIEWLKATASSAGSGLTPTSLAAERCRRVLRAG